MRELILQALRESVKAYPELKAYLSDEALLYYWIDFTKIGEAPDDDIRRKDERRLTRNLAKFLEGQLSRLLTYVRTHEIKGIQPSFWEDETAKLWAEYGEDFVGILMHGVEGGINLLSGHGTGYPIDQDRINTSLVRFGRQYRDKWLSKIDETSRQYVEEMITDWSLSGQPLSNLIKTLQNDQRSMFNKIRAERIAVTETTRLHALGNQAAWEEVGAVTQFRWNSAQDELVCDICRDGVDNSPYPLSQLSEKIPAHVNCRCWGTPIVSVEEHERDIERLLGMGEAVPITLPEGRSDTWKKGIMDAYNEIYRINPKLAEALLREIGYTYDGEVARAWGDGKIEVGPGFYKDNNLTKYDLIDVSKKLRYLKSKYDEFMELYKFNGDVEWLNKAKFCESEINMYKNLDGEILKGNATLSSYDTILHEMAHNLHTLMEEGQIEEIWEFGSPSELRDRLGDDYDWNDTIYKKLFEWSKTDDALRISVYATTNDKEYFAECFMTWITGRKEAKYIPARLIDIFERGLNGNIR